MSKADQMFSWRSINQVQMECELNLDLLFPDSAERKKFKSRWEEFKSDSCNKKIYHRKGNRLFYPSEQLIPRRADSRPALLMVFGNPASHSIKEGMFFSYEGKDREHRFWKDILKPAGILDLGIDQNLSVEERNRIRKKKLRGLDYEAPFRIGLMVFISMPSSSKGLWSGIQGIEKLLGRKAFRRLESAEKERIIKSSASFLGTRGTVICFNKNAWNQLRSPEDQDPDYKINLARRAQLKGTMSGAQKIPLYGLPPTRLAKPACNALRKYFPKIKSN